MSSRSCTAALVGTGSKGSALIYIGIRLLFVMPMVFVSLLKLKSTLLIVERRTDSFKAQKKEESAPGTG